MPGFSRIRCGVVLLLALGGLFAFPGAWSAEAAPAAKPAKKKSALALDILKMTGARTKFAWIQSQPGKGPGDSFGPMGQGRPSNKSFWRLMVFDTDEGKERVLMGQPTFYNHPLITPDGKHLVFSVGGQEVYVIDWEGKKPRLLLKNALAALAVAEDPPGTEWVYVAEGKEVGGCLEALYRYRLDDMTVREAAWTNTPVNDKLELSRDGKVAGGGFPWPHGTGIATFPNGSFTKLGQGCGYGMAPDGSGKFFHMGNHDTGWHRGLWFYDRPGAEARYIDLTKTLGMNGAELWYPGWVRYDVRFFTVTGPYQNIEILDPISDVMLCQFNADFTGIARYIRVTGGPGTKTQAYAWLQSPDAAPTTTVEQPKPVAAPATPTPAAEGWPLQRDKVAFLWENRNKQIVAFDPAGKEVTNYALTLNGRSRYGSFFTLLMKEGTFTADNAAAHIVAACRQSGAFSLEAFLTPAQTDPAGASDLIALAGAKGNVLALRCEKGKLLVVVRTAKGQTQLGLGPAGNAPTHLVVTFADGNLASYFDGKVGAKWPAAGALDWEADRLVFGGDNSAWKGLLEGVAIHARALSAAEAQESCQKYRERIASRKAHTRLVIQAKLVVLSKTPTFEKIAPYLRATVLYEYEIEKVVSGAYAGKRIRVAHWGVLDRKQYPIPREMGKSYTLTVEPFAENPQLESECMADDLPMDPDLPTYYEADL